MREKYIYQMTWIASLVLPPMGHDPLLHQNIVMVNHRLKIMIGNLKPQIKVLLV